MRREGIEEGNGGSRFHIAILLGVMSRILHFHLESLFVFPPGIARGHKNNRRMEKTNRRGFIGLLVLGYSSVALYVGGSLLSFLKFLFPNATYEPPQKFKAGAPSVYPEGSITFLTGRGVWIGHYPEGYAALIAKCTHLGCKPNWHPELVHEVFGAGLFECPCHGSKYDRYARNFYGPAPYPLLRANLSLAPDGRLEVDKSDTLSPKVKIVAGQEIDETKDPAFFLTL